MSTIDTTARSAMKLALEALEKLNNTNSHWWQEVDENVIVQLSNAESALREALAQERSSDEQPAQDNTYGYAKSLAEAIFKQHYASDEHYASGRIVWGVNDTVIGILTQIDNMVADMVRREEQPAQQSAERVEPVAIVAVDGVGQIQIGWIKKPQHNDKLYTSPPAQRKPLTGEEIASMMSKNLRSPEGTYFSFARDIEAAHDIGEKK